MVFGKVRIQTILITLGLIVLYFVTRLTHIMALPLFTDEAIYVRWSQIARQDAAWRFISLTDGKQPLFVWITMNIMRYVSDPLLSGRLTSVLAGFGSVLGVFFLTMEIFKEKRSGNIFNKIFGQLAENKRIGFIAALLFILYPFALVYDRMALYDSLVTCTMVWALYFEVLLVRYMRLDISLLTGAVIGSSVLTKTSGFFSIYLFPFSLVLFDFKEKNVRKRLLEWIAYAGISVAIGYLMYMILRLSPFFYIIDEKNALFVYPVSAWIKHPFEFASGHFNALTDWLFAYVSIPVFLLFLFSFIPEIKLWREKAILLIWFLVPFVGLGFFGNQLYPRFIFFMTTPIIILAAYSLNFMYETIKSKTAVLALFALSLGFFIFTDYFIITDMARAPIAKPDLGQYINSWPAGGGISEMVSFFTSQSKHGKIYVATQGTFGSLPTYAMEIYLGNNKNILKRGIYPLPSSIPSDLLQKAKTMPVYFVFNDSENAPASWPLTLVAKYQKGIGDRHLSIYKVNP